MKRMTTERMNDKINECPYAIKKNLSKRKKIALVSPLKTQIVLLKQVIVFTYLSLLLIF